MRIAWIGGVSPGGGAGWIGSLSLEAVLKAGEVVDYYRSAEEIPKHLLNYSNLTVVESVESTWWDWEKWYSNTPFKAFISGTIARIQNYNQISDKLLENHLKLPYDCIFQFSQTELFRLGSYLDQLPPLITYPGNHAAGEFYWHKKESSYALQVEPLIPHYLTQTYLKYRTWFQCGEMNKPKMVIGMSQRFNILAAKDYKLLPERQDILYHPIPLPSNQNIAESDALAKVRKEVNLLFVSRMSVRKGLEYVIELSHRLQDLEGQVNIKLIGGYTQWSNYSGHLKDLNLKTAQYMRSMNRQELTSAYINADVLIIPSLYEPGGIVVGEALSHGVCVVASDAIGSAEVLSGPAIREFPAGDMDKFEQTVRQLIKELQSTNRQPIRDAARAECKQHFDPDKIGGQLIEILSKVSGKEREIRELVNVADK